MNVYSKISAGLIGGVLVALFTGCVESGSGSARVGYVQTSASVDPVFGDSDDYVYYPGYETYYGRRTHRYYYRNGSSWVGRSQPTVSANVLLTAPSVNVDFHDSPARHHTEVTKRYPRQWRANNDHNNGNDHNNDHRDDNRR
ncbi:MAG: hypothetical protein JWM35_281 [Verrucomicrobia bacterium]|nr:hypothetical protein [Verrucomicrobiota bacterium]